VSGTILEFDGQPYSTFVSNRHNIQSVFLMMLKIHESKRR